MQGGDRKAPLRHRRQKGGETLRLWYKEKDITDAVGIASCETVNASGRLCTLTAVLERAENWYSWGPQAGDTIRATAGNLDTGLLYVDSLLPDEGRFRIFAVSARQAVRQKAWKSYEGQTFGRIANLCAAECGLEPALYGMASGQILPYCVRRDETPVQFLQRLAAREGAFVKCSDGRMNVISADYAAGLKAGQTLRLEAGQNGFTHIKSETDKAHSLTVAGPSGRGTAHDLTARAGLDLLVTDAPDSDETARRWAKGLLYMHNRQAEKLILTTALNGAFVALSRVDVTGIDVLAGEWLVEETTNDLIRETTLVTLMRA